MKPEISEEIVSGWRRESKELVRSARSGVSIEDAYIAGKISSHERILELEKENLELAERNARLYSSMSETTKMKDLKLTKRDELLKSALPYIENADDCELSIGEKTINTEKWIKNYKQLEQEK